MLFSDDRIAKFINENFEAAWQNVRAVPIVTIDFGGGHVLTRTLNGNIATHVCTAEGHTLDVLPGIYEPETYLDQLDQFVKLYRYVTQNTSDRAARLAEYHQQQAKSLADGGERLMFADIAGRTKARIERGVKFALMPRRFAAHVNPRTAVAKDAEFTTASSAARLDDKQDLARWKLLAEDTRMNETLRRRAIHEYLADKGFVTPQSITRWLYREVLHADLDDPYLGLGKTLFATYPFQDG